MLLMTMSGTCLANTAPPAKILTDPGATLMMNDDQIFEIASIYLTHFADGQGRVKWSGKPEDLVNFALVMYNRGVCEGAYQQSKRYMKENLPDV